MYENDIQINISGIDLSASSDYNAIASDSSGIPFQYLDSCFAMLDTLNNSYYDIAIKALVAVIIMFAIVFVMYLRILNLKNKIAQDE